MEETIKQRQVPEENIQEINKFYEKMLALQLEKESADKGVTNELKKKKKKNYAASSNKNEEGETDGS